MIERRTSESWNNLPGTEVVWEEVPTPDKITRSEESWILSSSITPTIQMHNKNQQPSSAIGHFVVADSCSEAFRFKSVYILANPESECVFFFDFPLPAHFAALTD